MPGFFGKKKQKRGERQAHPMAKAFRHSSGEKPHVAEDPNKEINDYFARAQERLERDDPNTVKQLSSMVQSELRRDEVRKEEHIKPAQSTGSFARSVEAEASKRATTPDMAEKRLVEKKVAEQALMEMQAHAGVNRQDVQTLSKALAQRAHENEYGGPAPKPRPKPPTAKGVVDDRWSLERVHERKFGEAEDAEAQEWLRTHGLVDKQSQKEKK